MQFQHVEYSTGSQVAFFGQSVGSSFLKISSNKVPLRKYFY